MEASTFAIYKIVFLICLLIVVIYLLIDLPPSGDGGGSSSSINFLPKDIRLKFDGEKYVVDNSDDKLYKTEPRQIKSLGSKLACDSLAEILGQKVKYDTKIPGTRSPNTDDSIITDCYEPTLRLAVDYHPESFYEYDGIDRYNIDIYEFSDRLFLNEVKREQLDQLKTKYIEIPYTVDMCEKTHGSVECHEYVSPKERKRKIKEYLQSRIYV